MANLEHLEILERGVVGLEPVAIGQSWPWTDP